MVTPEVPLYVERPSTTCGNPVAVHLGGSGAQGVVVRAYRVGWYSGAGARLVWSSSAIKVPRTAPTRRRGTTVPSPNWATTLVLPVDASWLPGLYVIESDVAGRIGGVSALVVRNAADPRPAVVMYSNLTWSAYSPFGGASLYFGATRKTVNRALQVAIQRPITGPGLLRLLAEDVPVAQQIDRLGLPIDPTVDTDVDTQPSLLAHRTEIVLPGHSEYWTRRMYDAFTAGRNDGANIADLGANEIYWQTRLAYGSSGVPTTMFVARSLAEDPLATAHPSDATVEWRNPPLRRDPAAVIGPSYAAVRVHGSLQVRSVPSWLQGIPGLTAGAILRGVIENEADGARQGTPHPDNLQIIALGVVRRTGAADKPVSITYYSSRTGGGVFAAGTTYWPCLTSAACPDATGSATTRKTMWAITSRVLQNFSIPHWGASHPSTQTGVPATGGLAASLPSAAVGTYGGGD